ncbi:MAG TPA: helix-hairpin-helix domain-containing protein [Solirubrobacterales bacterium]|nr:helix-hairpin-helix domain-containing protein [Solirubrobacterales bacterium]
MPQINRQMLVYAVVGGVLLLVGFNSIRGEKSESASFGGDPAGGGSRAESGADGGSGSGGFEVSGSSRKLIVDVAGAVRRPGVYRFSQGARVIDAIERAGGTTRGAFVGAINRAATLSDGQQVIVPSATEAGAAGGTVSIGGTVSGTEAASAPVSLGTATQEQLEEIDGIGPVTAEKILEFRDAQGGLGSIDELDQISGIGPVTMESLRAALTP